MFRSDLVEPNKLSKMCFLFYTVQFEFTQWFGFKLHRSWLWFHRSKRLLWGKLTKYLPLDLRPKKTRAIRRHLTKHQVYFLYLCHSLWIWCKSCDECISTGCLMTNRLIFRPQPCHVLQNIKWWLIVNFSSYSVLYYKFISHYLNGNGFEIHMACNIKCTSLKLYLPLKGMQWMWKNEILNLLSSDHSKRPSDKWIPEIESEDWRVRRNGSSWYEEHYCSFS